MAKPLRIIKQNYAPLLTTLSIKNTFRNYAKAKPQVRTIKIIISYYFTIEVYFQKDDPYILLRARPNDYKETMDVMYGSYFTQEPTFQSISYGGKKNALLDEVVLRALEEGVSVIAKCKYTGKIVAASINESTVPWNPEILDRIACSSTCIQLRHIFHFWAYLQQAPKLWEKFDVQKVLEVSK